MQTAKETREAKKILLIDDDSSLLVTLSDFLRFEGYDVITADSGEQGLKKLEQVTPDLIILDMSMPGMGGIGFLKEISSTEGKPNHPVLVLTARANMAEFFANIDIEGFIAKPCDPNDLLMEVSRIIFLRGGTEINAGANARSRKNKVLIAEDDLSVCENIRNSFAQEGFIVDAVSRGPEVLEKAIIEKPDIIVTKLVFPGMNGDAVASMLKEMPNTRNIPIVLYDNTDLGSSDKYMKAGSGITKFLKTNNPEQLVSAVKKILSVVADQR